MKSPAILSVDIIIKYRLRSSYVIRKDLKSRLHVSPWNINLDVTQSLVLVMMPSLADVDDKKNHDRVKLIDFISDIIY